MDLRAGHRLRSLLLLFAVVLIQQCSFCHAFRPYQVIQGKSIAAISEAATEQGYRPGRPLLGSPLRKSDLHSQVKHNRKVAGSTALSMVLTTPEAIIEQASTVNLLDDLIDESVRTSARRPIMRQFDPSSGWIWRQWKGTIFSETWPTCVKNIAYAFIIFLLFKRYPHITEYLNGFGTLWGQLLSVTTFTLTFFVNQSYALWRKCSELSRRLQGRLHDIGMNLATHATRKTPTSPGETSTYTAASRQVLELMSRYIRLFNLLTYASFTRSHRPILTPRGMRRLVERGLMTAQEREVLVDAAIPATQRHSAILMWMIRLFVEGRASGHILGGDGFEQQTMEKFHIIRAQYGAIGDELQGRMPLAYAHVVQVLVDLILWMYPVMAFSIGMSPLIAIAGTGLLTLSYQGLFDLAKQFLDPYDNENYGKGEDPLSVDTLIAETNAGSVRWMYGFEEMPFSQEKLKEGELYDYLLPVRGYTVEELAQMEEEKIRREKEAEEQRLRGDEKGEAATGTTETGLEESKLREDSFNDDSNENVGNSTSNGKQSKSIVDVDSRENAEGREELAVEGGRVIHKVFTLADGTVVSFNEEPTILAKAPATNFDGKLPAPDPGVPEGVGPYLASLSDLDGRNIMDTRVQTQPPTVVGSESIKSNSVWDADETIDSEKNLGENLADGVNGAKKATAMNSSADEDETRLEPANCNSEVETIQSIEKKAPVVTHGKETSQKTTPSAEKVGNITQAMEETRQSNDIIAFDSSQISTKADIAKVMGEGKVMDTLNGEAESTIMANSDQESKGNLEKKEEPARLTLDDYNKEVEKIIEAAKEEMLETEAILNARPGYDPVGWDYDDEQLAPSTDAADQAGGEGNGDSQKDTETSSAGEDDLIVLEMDLQEPEISAPVSETKDCLAADLSAPNAAADKKDQVSTEFSTPEPEESDNAGTMSKISHQGSINNLQNLDNDQQDTSRQNEELTSDGKGDTGDTNSGLGGDDPNGLSKSQELRDGTGGR